jgi:hypothetical protein
MGSLPTAKLLENLFERNRLSALTLRNRLEKHSFGLRVGVERFVSFWKEHGHRRAFRKFGIVQLNATADDPTRSNSHKGSIPRSGRGQIATWLHDRLGCITPGRLHFRSHDLIREDDLVLIWASVFFPVAAGAGLILARSLLNLQSRKMWSGP